MPKLSRDIPPEAVRRVVLKAVGENFRISREALNVICEFVENLIKEIAVESAKITSFTKRKTIKKRDIEFVLEDITKIFK